MLLIRYCVIVLLLAGCSTLPQRATRVSDEDSQQVFQRFQKLQPPFDSATALRVLGDPQWMRHTKFYDPDFTSGFWPLHELFGNSGIPTVATLRAGTHTEAGWSIYLHFRSAITADVERRYSPPAAYPSWWTPPFGDGHAQKFFRGQASPDIQVDEYSLCYPDGHILNVRPRARKIIPPDTYHL